jgi:hypothetical protein
MNSSFCSKGFQFFSSFFSRVLWCEKQQQQQQSVKGGFLG